MVRVERKQSKDVEGGIVESCQSWGVLSRLDTVGLRVQACSIPLIFTDRQVDQKLSPSVSKRLCSGRRLDHHVVSHYDPPLAPEPKILKFRTHSNPPLDHRPQRGGGRESHMHPPFRRDLVIGLEAFCDILTLKVVK